MIIVTAGHVDHGKTTLIQALTGTDTDRLPEEKRRGMTIDLGYAFMDINRDERLGFIDVPGHEKFINNMLTGVSNAKHAMLVVACDDGVMPQTQEHLDILELLPLESLTLVLTKCDIASSAQISATQNSINQLLNIKNRLVKLPRHFFAVSAKNKLGINELKSHLCDLVVSDSDKESCDNNAFRMNIDRVFTVKGAGIVATGTVLSGKVDIEDKLWCSGQSSALRVRSIHAQGMQTDSGKVGQRVALNLAGSNNHNQPKRGDWLTSLSQPDMTNRITAVFMGNASLKHWQSVHCHHGASHTLARIGYLSRQSENEHLIELILDKPLLLTQLDTLVIRDAVGKNTLGGMRVLELNPPLRGKRKPERLTYLSQLAKVNTPQTILPIEANNQAVNINDLRWRWQMSANGLNELIQQQDLQQIDNDIIHTDLLGELKASLLDIIAQYHAQFSDEQGIGQSRLQRMLHSRLTANIINFAINSLCDEQLLQQSRGLIHLPQHQLFLTDKDLRIWQQMQLLYPENGEPLWVSDFSEQLKIDTKEIKALCSKLVQLGYLIKVVKDRYVQTSSLYDYANKIRDYLKYKEDLETAEFRQLINMGRKVSIQLLELFDKTGFTQRKFGANCRRIRDAEMYLNTD